MMRSRRFYMWGYEMSKGSDQRPTDLKRFKSNWDAIYGKPEKKKEPINKNPKTWKEFHVEAAKIEADKTS